MVHLLKIEIICLLNVSLKVKLNEEEKLFQIDVSRGESFLK